MHMHPNIQQNIFPFFLQVQKYKLKTGEQDFCLGFSSHLKILTLEHLLGNKVRQDFPRIVPKLEF